MSRLNKKHKYSLQSDVKLSTTTPVIIQEAYKSIRTNLMFALGTSDNKTVIVSSASPSECKSTTAANLAISTAQLGTKVLLIDADMRKPTIHKIFRQNNDKGLSRLVVGFDELKNCIHKNVEPNLDIITSGPIPPNPAELIGSPSMLSLLEGFKDEYDVIFIDSPPINMLSDAIILAPSTAGIILLARQGNTTYPELQRAIAAIEFSKAAILGIVIADSKNYFESHRKYNFKYNGSSGYGYSYGYGYGASNTNKTAGLPKKK